MEIGIGTSQLRSLGRRASLAEVRALLRAAEDLGVRWIDTADTYGAGSAERAIARAAVAEGLQASMRVVTKIGYRTPDLPGPLRALNQPAKKLLQRRRPQSFDERALRAAWAASQRRLRGLPVHACCLHNPPAPVLTGGAIAVLTDLRDAGGFRAVGVSVDDDEIVRLLPSLAGIDLVELPATSWMRLSRDDRAALTGRGVEVVVNRVSAIDRDPVVALTRLAADPQPPTVAVVGTRNPVHLAADAAAVRG